MKKQDEVKEKRTLKQIREAAGLSQQELSQQIKCGLRVVTNWENGRQMPKFDNAVAIARALNCSLIELAEAMGMDVNGIPD